MIRLLIVILLASSIFACEIKPPKKTSLPILGEKEVVKGDTIYHTIPDYTFVNQDSVVITPETFDGKAYIVDYFFTSCPTICPKVKANTLRIEERFRDNENLSILSVSIDPKYDTIPRLKWYANKLELDTKQWHFVTGEKDLIYGIANDFFHIAMENEDAPGGFDHDGRLILIDKQKHIRSFCDGTDAEDVDRFMEDIDLLLSEK